MVGCYNFILRTTPDRLTFATKDEIFNGHHAVDEQVVIWRVEISMVFTLTGKV